MEMYNSACKRPPKWLQKFWIDDVAFYGIFAKENYHTLINSDQFAMDSADCRVPCLAWHHHPLVERSLDSLDLTNTLFKEMLNCTVCVVKCNICVAVCVAVLFALFALFAYVKNRTICKAKRQEK